MPLGRTALRNLRGMSPVLLTLLQFGCSAVPPSSRVIPRTADIHTRLQPDRGASSTAESSLETTEMSGDAKRLLNTLDETSPLPPALPKPIPAIDFPPSLPTIPTQAASVKPEPAPIRDEAVGTAEARTVGHVDEATQPAEAEVVVKPNPDSTTLPPSETKIADGPTPLPSPSPSPLPINPAPTPEVKPAVSEPLKPEDVWREGVEKLRVVARDHLNSVDKESKPGLSNWLVRERLLGWLAEPSIDSDNRAAANAAQGQAVLKGLAAVLDPSGAPAIRGTEIREAVATLEAQNPLEITELKLCRIVHSFGNIEPLEPARKAGQSVILYCELAGLTYEPAGSAFRSRVAAEVELIPQGSESPSWTHNLSTAEDVCRRRRRDFFIGHKFTLPDSLAAGNYRLRLTEKDLVTHQVATMETAIVITR